MLVVVSLIVFTTYTKLKGDTEGKIDNALETLISDRSEKYIKDNKENIHDGNVYCITLKNLLDENLMSAPVKNSSGEIVKESTRIKISVINGHYEVKVNVSSCEEKVVAN